MQIRRKKIFATATALGTVMLLANTVLVGCGGSSSGAKKSPPPTAVAPGSPPPLAPRPGFATLPPSPPTGTSPPPSPPPNPPPPPSPPGTPPPPPTPPPRTLPSFLPSTNFQNKCAFVEWIGDVRSPVKNRDELNFVRSWLYETNLFNYDINDLSDAKFKSHEKDSSTKGAHLKVMEEYLEEIKNNSDKAFKDNDDAFHHVEFATEAVERYDGQIDPYHGLSFFVVDGAVPRDIRVRRVNPNSPAAKVDQEGNQTVKRGDKLLEFTDIASNNVVNVKDGTGASLIYDIEFLINGHWKLNLGQSFKYKFEDRDTKKIKERVLVAKRDTVDAVSKQSIINYGGRKIAYVALDTMATLDTEKLMNKYFFDYTEKDVNELVLDLRNNQGGLIHNAAQIAFMIAGEEKTKDKMFAKIKLNYDAETTGPRRNRIPLAPIEFGQECQENTDFDCDKQNLTPLYEGKFHSLNLNRVFILTSKHTCGASEALINGLRALDDFEVILIGADTCGQIYGALPRWNCGLTYYGTQFEIMNGKDEGKYSNGFGPKNSPSSNSVKVNGCYVNDDVTKEIGAADDVLLKTALNYIKDGESSCPSVSANQSTSTATNNQNAQTVNPVQKQVFGFNLNLAERRKDTR